MIYLDHAATSLPKAPGVAEAVVRALTGAVGSPGRASHSAALEASRIQFRARGACARLLEAADPARVVFTGSATEALNLAILGSVPAGGCVAFGTLEHNAVMRPLRHLEARRGVRLLPVPFDACGRPDPAALRAVLGARPDLMVLTAASNVTGGCPPVAEIGAACRAAGVPLCVDASQALGHLPLHLPESDVPLLCGSGHKGLRGPAGIGLLRLAEGFAPEPLVHGGTGSESASERQPEALPDRYEAGTPNLPGLAGLLAALEWLEGTGVAVVAGRERALCERLLRGLLELPGVRAFGPGPGEPRAPVVSITVAGWDLGELALELDRREVATRAGLHCAPAAHRHLGTLEAGGTLRFSPGFSTTEAEIDETLDILEGLLA